MKIKTIAALALAAFVSAPAMADEYGELIRIDRLGNLLVNTGDSAHFYTLQVRCLATYSVLGQVFESAGQTKVAAQFFQASVDLLEATPSTKLAKSDRKPTYAEKEQVKKDSIKIAYRYSNMLFNRMTHNSDTTGEMFSNDEIIKSDIKACKKFFYS
tara:strand:+ start:676 stop:1146 length:471 start_codon:yes stop_codon:yes gene_type:complete